jgi:hypothetical protein
LKKILFYAVCQNGTIDVVIEGEGNYNYLNLEMVKKDFPERNYKYIKEEE